MKALILNSGLGTRMGVLTSEHPKCMTEITSKDTILSRQLRQLADYGITEVVITTGLFAEVLVDYCQSLDLPIHIEFVYNPRFRETNYIYSIECARDLLKDEDILLMHGDLVYENSILEELLESSESRMTVSSTLPLPQKDFKAVIREGRIRAVGINFFDHAMTAQPLYLLRKDDWNVWLDAIHSFIEAGNEKVYAENAFNEVSDRCRILPFDVGSRLCSEIDNPEDLAVVSARVHDLENRTVYLCFSTDMLHSGHIRMINRARRLGKLIVGVLSDEAVVTYKRFPLLPCAERMAMFRSVAGVWKVVEQKTLSYKDVLAELKPDIVVHGDNWVTGFQKPIRDEVVSILASYGGRLVEYPYMTDERYRELDRRAREELSSPDIRRGRLRKAMALKGCISVMEAHGGLTGLIVENTVVHTEGGARQFDAMWSSSLCDSTSKGKPDIELVDMSSRFGIINDIMEVTTKPIIFDGDTGGRIEHFVYTVRTLERLGVSMVIIEDKTGLKKNSLFGTEVEQTQDSIEHFSQKIAAGKAAQKTADFMICARIESLILERGMEDALERAFAFVKAGADAIMIHSRRKEPDEIFEFVDRFRSENKTTPIVVVPTSFNSVTEEEFRARGVNIVIYANQLMRAAVPAMTEAAESILTNHRAMECDSGLMPFKDIIRMIPEE